jgi:GT2 family glycosyltransferase
VAVVLVHWNSGPATQRCIDSLRASDYEVSHIVVVDNGSTDVWSQAGPSADGHLTVIRNAANEGFTRACNAAVAFALESQQPEYVWILNNDAVVDPGCLRALVGRLTSAERIGAVTGKILYPDRQTIWFGGSAGSRIGEPHQVGKGQPDGPAYNRAGELPFISGCCLLTSAAVWKQVGGLDEQLFAYYEDVDWCHRARQLGWVLYYEPAAVLVHEEGTSLSRNRASGTPGHSSPLALRLLARNRLLVQRKHRRGFWPRSTAIGWSLCFSLIRATRLMLVGRPVKARAVLRGVSEGLTAAIAPD